MGAQEMPCRHKENLSHHEDNQRDLTLEWAAYTVCATSIPGNIQNLIRSMPWQATEGSTKLMFNTYFKQENGLNDFHKSLPI